MHRHQIQRSISRVEDSHDQDAAALPPQRKTHPIMTRKRRIRTMMAIAPQKGNCKKAYRDHEVDGANRGIAEQQQHPVVSTSL
jgi:hypothetical protein